MHPYIEIFGEQLPLYGLLLALGAILGILLLMLYTRNKYPYELIDLCFFVLWAFVGGVIGTKLLYLIVELDTLIKHPELFLVLLRGGGVFYGGLLGGIIGAYFGARKYKLNFLCCLDMCAPSIALAQAFGRVGCFMGGCCYGCETDSIFGVIYPEGGSAPAGVPLLPTQLFETAFLLLLTVILLVVLRRIGRRGATASVYLLGYGVWRFIIEFFRADSRGSVGALSTSQFISIFIVAAGILLLLPKVARLFDKKEEKAEVSPPAN